MAHTKQQTASFFIAAAGNHRSQVIVVGKHVLWEHEVLLSKFTRDSERI